MTARRWYAVGAAGVVALGLGACNGGGDDPPTTSTTSSSTSSTTTSGTSSSTTTSSSATATIDPAKLPPEARKHTPEGAAAFVEYFIEQSNEAWTKPDDRLLPPLSESGCKSCKALQGTAKDLIAKKQRYESDPFTLREVTPVPGAPKGQQFGPS